MIYDTARIGARWARTKPKNGELAERLKAISGLLPQFESEDKRFAELFEAARERGVDLNPNLMKAVDDAHKSLDIALIHVRCACRELREATREDL